MCQEAGFWNLAMRWTRRMDTVSRVRRELDDKTAPGPVWPRQTAGRPLLIHGPGPRTVEESPGSTGMRCRLTTGGGDPRESATEITPPAQASRDSPRARAKRCGKSAPRAWQQERHGKPHREQDRIGMVASQGAGAFPPCCPGWSREARREVRPR